VGSPPVISHNAAIVFPIDVSERVRAVAALGPGTAFEVQTKSTCASPQMDAFSLNVRAVEASIGLIPALGSRDVASLNLTMPYRTPADDYVRVPTGLCAFVRSSGSRDFTPVGVRIMAMRDDAAEMATAVLPVDQGGIDALAVLSEDTIVVSEITIELR
jgi:hypothetical protein